MIEVIAAVLFSVVASSEDLYDQAFERYVTGESSRWTDIEEARDFCEWLVDRVMQETESEQEDQEEKLLEVLSLLQMTAACIVHHRPDHKPEFLEYWEESFVLAEDYLTEFLPDFYNDVITLSGIFGLQNEAKRYALSRLQVLEWSYQSRLAELNLVRAEIQGLKRAYGYQVLLENLDPAFAGGEISKSDLECALDLAREISADDLQLDNLYGDMKWIGQSLELNLSLRLGECSPFRFAFDVEKSNPPGFAVAGWTTLGQLTSDHWIKPTLERAKCPAVLMVLRETALPETEPPDCKQESSTGRSNKELMAPLLYRLDSSDFTIIRAESTKIWRWTYSILHIT